MATQPPRISTFFQIFFMCACVALLAGCGGSALPKSAATQRSPWNSFEEAMAAYEQVVLHHSNTEDLRRLGFDPYTTPNVKILSYLDLIQRFMPNNSIKVEDLDDNLRACIKARETCLAYEAHPKHIHSERVGSVFLDLLRFKRHTIETGWQFKALIVIQNGVAVYKIWSGQPIIDQEKSQNNPLGPLQDSGGSIMKDAAGL